MVAKTAYIADYLEQHKHEILDRWRDAAQQEQPQQEQAQLERLSKIDDRDLLDHLPALTEALISVLRKGNYGPVVVFDEPGGGDGNHHRARRGLNHDPRLSRRSLFRAGKASARHDKHADTHQQCKSTVIDRKHARLTTSEFHHDGSLVKAAYSRLVCPACGLGLSAALQTYRRNEQ
jgi:hypothetical protein